MKTSLYFWIVVISFIVAGCSRSQAAPENVAPKVTISVKNNEGEPLAHARIEHMFLYEDGTDSGSPVKVIADGSGVYSTQIGKRYPNESSPSSSMQVWVHVPGYRSERQIFQYTQQETNIEFRLDRETK